MISLQDKQIMRRYFTEMLFQPLLDKVIDLETSAAEVVTDEIKINVRDKAANIELLPLPQQTQQRTKPPAPTETNNDQQSVNAVSEVEKEVFEDFTAEEEYPWTSYQWDNERPPWAQENFDCLLFEVCGFNFAVPLITLGQIQMITADLTPVFGQAPWFMGLQQTALGSMRVVNTAQFVMPERYQPDNRYKPTYLMSIANCSWSLAVDEVKQPIYLSPSDVKWRQNRQRQIWLAGVLKEQMCVLIDIPALANQLLAAEK